MGDQRQSDQITVKNQLASTAPFLAASLALVVYLFTLPPSLTWAHYGHDGGDLITASYTLGVPHPPGYPIYIILGRLFAFLPVGSIAYRYNLFSALSAAVATGFITALVGHSQWTATLRRTPGRTSVYVVPVATGLTLAFMPLVWSQAIIAEVYTLHLAFLAIFLWLLLTGRSPFITGFFLGLALTSHLTALLMLPLALINSPRRRWISMGTGLLIGLLFFLLPVFLARLNSPVVWSDPTTPAGWWWLVSARIYQPNLFSLPIEHWSPRLANFVLGFGAQFAWMGLIIIAVGMTYNWSKRRLFYLSAVITLIFYALYTLLYDAPDAAVFFLPGLLLLSILLADGLYLLRGAALLLPVFLLMLNFAKLNLHHDLQPGRLVKETLTSLPQDAIVMTPGNQTIFTLWYFHHIEEMRTDLILVDSNLFAFDWYRQRLGSQYPELTALEMDDVPAFQKGNDARPVCDVNLDPVQVHCTSARTN